MLLNNRYTYVLLSIINEKNVLNLDITKVNPTTFKLF